MNREYLTALVTVAILILLELSGYFFPVSLNWGFHFLGFLPPFFTVLYLLLGVSGLIVIMRYSPAALLARAARFMAEHPAWFLTISLALFLVCATILRIKIPLLGDGMYIVKNFAEVSRGEAPLYPRSEPLATYYFYFLMMFLEKPSYAGLLNAFWLGGLLCGTGFMIAGFFTVKSLFHEPVHRLLAFLLVITLPYMQLFFGYVETYSPVLLVLSLLILASALNLEGKLPFAAPAIMFTLQALIHYITLLIFPAVVFLAIREFRRSGWKQVAVGAAAGAAIVLLTLTLLGFDSAKLFTSTPQEHFLALTRPADFFNDYSQAYTLFSPYHALDLANYLVLMAPASLVLLTLALRKDRGQIFRSPPMIFLSLIVVPIGAFLLVAKFDLAAARDWDVLSMYFYPLALLGSIAFLQTFGTERLRAYSLLLLVSALNAFALFSVNASRDAGISRFATLPDKRITSGLAYYSGFLGLSIYYHEAGDPISPVKLWRRYSEEYPLDPRGYLNIVTNLKRIQGTPADSLATVYERWIRNLPDDSLARSEYGDFNLGAGNACFARGSLDSARLYYRRAIDVEPSSPKAWNNLGSVYAREHHPDSALGYFRRAIALDSTYSDPYYNLSSAYEDLGRRQDALASLKEAGRLGNPSAQEALKKRGISP